MTWCSWKTDNFLYFFLKEKEDRRDVAVTGVQTCALPIFGVVGAATFLGMALGPFAGAFVLGGFDLGPWFAATGGAGSTTAGLLVPAWRWVFYLGAPLAVVGAIFIWAAAPAWPPPEPRGRV